jgi:polysaccharide biosynthesis protein PslA
MDGTSMSRLIDMSGEPVCTTMGVLPLLRSDIIDTDVDQLFVQSRLLRKQWMIYKRCQDVILAAILAVSLCVIFLAIGMWIKRDSSGPVLFSQPRRGRHNISFSCYKFRTMYHDCADIHARKQSIMNDSRVTRVGKPLRRLSLDELPQIINVLKGHMSLVGPRPHAIGTNINGRLLTELDNDYLLRYTVKPGITGWAQVNGCRGILDTEEKLRNRLKYDFEYIANWSPLLDIHILYKTFFCIFDDRAF